MKNLLKIFAIFVAFALTHTSTVAAENLLHSITLEKNNSGYNVILDTDMLAKVTKKTPSNDELILDLKGVTSSETVNAIYKGTNDIGGLIIENSSPNKLRIIINALNIKDSTIMGVNPDGTVSIVAETIPVDKILWMVFVMSLFVVIRRISKSIAEEDDKIIIKKDIKEREIQMYRKYKSALSGFQSFPNRMSSVNNLQKKIDRKINDRLTAMIK